ncbi:unnamed protein product [Boreogadus saida]
MHGGEEEVSRGEVAHAGRCNTLFLYGELTASMWPGPCPARVSSGNGAWKYKEMLYSDVKCEDVQMFRRNRK